jgi:DsbC/DsbD-like thiol-disulfide interchange protein
MRAQKILLPLILVLAAVPLAAATGPWERNPQSSVRLISPWQVAPVSPRDGELRLGLHFKLAPGWHVYWKNSGDAGFPPVVELAKNQGLESAEMLWPAPERFELRGGLVAFGYADEVVYPIRAKLASGAAGPLRISADVDYLVCEVDCVPYRYTLSLDQPLGASPLPDPAAAPLVEAWWSRLPVAADALAGVTTDGVLEPGGPALGPALRPVLEIRLHGVQPAAGTTPGLFLESHEAFDTGKPEARKTDGGVVFRVPLKAHESGKPLPRETDFVWTATGLVRDGRAVSVEARRTVPLGASSAAPPPVKVNTVRRPDPVLIALLAVAATLGALWLWGLLGVVRETAHGSRTRREAFGFGAAAVTFGALWGMSRQVSFVGLAWIELVLLAMALCAWLRHRMSRRRSLGFLLALCLAVCAAAAPWLAHRNRLTPTATPEQEDSPT